MTNTAFQVSGNIIDVVNRKIFKGTITVANGRIAALEETENVPHRCILPGFTDAHIHIESSMLIPSEFARLAVVHGTVSTVSDPHEIGNVLGAAGVRFMIGNGKKVPFKFNFGAPSCVPATPFETAGATIGVAEVDELLRQEDVRYLSEMMNFPGVLFKDPVVMEKLALARKYGKPVDGHAPGVKGSDAEKYIQSGISTDHECFTIEEALEKISYGMMILIREGSAAKNFETLAPLIGQYPDKVMFCSDDKHPNDLVHGHINELVKRAVAKGYNIMNILQCCTVNPVMHYKLDTGLLRVGDDADFIVTDNLLDFNILETYIRGVRVAAGGKSLIRSVDETPVNRFETNAVTLSDIRIPVEPGKIRVVRALDGQLITPAFTASPLISEGNVVSDTERDILKIVVKNRYSESVPAVGFISGFGIKMGAIASSVAHDSHNIIAVGADDESIVKAINLIIETRGGISLVNGDSSAVMGLPVGGIMSGDDGYRIAAQYDELDRMAKQLGSVLHAPYMTLSFMALLVIPELKLSDKGLFDGTKFEFVKLFCGE
jgi:adenine deaminase